MEPTLTLIDSTVIGNHWEKWRVPEVRYHACWERGASPQRPSQTRAGEEAPRVRWQLPVREWIVEQRGGEEWRGWRWVWIWWWRTKCKWRVEIWPFLCRLLSSLMWMRRENRQHWGRNAEHHHVLAMEWILLTNSTLLDSLQWTWSPRMIPCYQLAPALHHLLRANEHKMKCVAVPNCQKESGLTWTSMTLVCLDETDNKPTDM